MLSAKNPKTWVNPPTTKAVHSFKGSSPQELTFQTDQTLIVAPREVQQTHNLLNTGWALASIDNVHSGLVPINYLRKVKSQTNTMPPPISTSMPTTPLKSNSNPPYDEQVNLVENSVLQSEMNIEENEIFNTNNFDVVKDGLQNKLDTVDDAKPPQTSDAK